jgi:hypothetical protein
MAATECDRIVPSAACGRDRRRAPPLAMSLFLTRESQWTAARAASLGWSRELSSARAPVVRETLERAPLPVLLVPVSAQGEIDSD